MGFPIFTKEAGKARQVRTIPTRLSCSCLINHTWRGGFAFTLGSDNSFGFPLSLSSLPDFIQNRDATSRPQRRVEVHKVPLTSYLPLISLRFLPTQSSNNHKAEPFTEVEAETCITDVRFPARLPTTSSTSANTIIVSLHKVFR